MDHQLQEFEVVTLAVKRSGGMFGLGQKVTLLTQRHLGRAEYRIEELGNNVSLELAAIPGGSFQMGSPDDDPGCSRLLEKPQHRVTVQPFWIGKYPITQAHWRAVAELPKIHMELNPDLSHFRGDNRPVEQVDRYDIVEFCFRLSEKTGHTYRLPTEAEWEYACRAGTTTPFHFGETITTDLANYWGTAQTNSERTASGYYGAGLMGQYREQTTEVGSFPPNAFGLYDVHGNVFEVCWDDSREGPLKNAWTIGGMSSCMRLHDVRLRGGSWATSAASCRSACSILDSRFVGNTTGFRVVCCSS